MADARIEAVAQVLNALFAERCGTPSVWADEPEHWKEQFRGDARLALAAADSVARALMRL